MEVTLKDGDKLRHGAMAIALRLFRNGAFATKENVTANPIHIRLLGADRIMFDAQMPADAVEQFRGGSGYGCRRRHIPSSFANLVLNYKPELRGWEQEFLGWSTEENVEHPTSNIGIKRVRRRGHLGAVERRRGRRLAWAVCRGLVS